MTLGWILDQKKMNDYKGYYWDNEKKLNMKYILSSSIVYVLNFLNLIISLWLYKGMSLLTEVTC